LYTKSRTLVIRQGLMLAALRVAIAAILAAVGSHYLGGLLFGVRTADPMTFAGACVLFTAIALVASHLPARRAARVDPMIALRCD
jgi:putative ABC transport system permease protein